MAMPSSRAISRKSSIPDDKIGTPNSHARWATPLAPVAEEYGSTSTLALRNNPAMSSSSTYPVNSIVRIAFHLFRYGFDVTGSHGVV